MNKIFNYKVLKLFLLTVFLRTGFSSNTQDSPEIIVIAISESYAINPLSDKPFYLQSGMSFKSLPGSISYKYLPDFGFGYKISKNLSFEGSIFNHSSYSSPEQITRVGVQYFFGTTDTLDWSCSIKKVNYRSIKNFDINQLDENVFESYGWGYGFRVNMKNTKFDNVGEFGWGGAASTYFIVDRKNSISAVLMTQVFQGDLSLQKDFYNYIYSQI